MCPRFRGLGFQLSSLRIEVNTATWSSYNKGYGNREVSSKNSDGRRIEEKSCTCRFSNEDTEIGNHYTQHQRSYDREQQTNQYHPLTFAAHQNENKITIQQYRQRVYVCYYNTKEIMIKIPEVQKVSMIDTGSSVNNLNHKYLKKNEAAKTKHPVATHKGCLFGHKRKQHVYS